jgi:flagellar biosynthesis GTPase FlhF
MRSLTNSKPSVDGAPAVVTARTLKEAYKKVRQEYGSDAAILGTRTVNQRQDFGLGHDKCVEVTVQLPGTTPNVAALGHRTPGGALDRIMATAAPEAEQRDIRQDLLREVARIEELAASIAAEHARLARRQLPFCDNPLAETLIENGASAEAVNTILTRFTSETGAKVQDRPAAVAWLNDNLRASNCTWDDFYGCHAFLGETGSGRSDLVLTAAALLQQKGRRTLVLSLMPGNNGDIRRLQHEAAQHGFDAAVIKKEAQLAATAKHLTAYDVVLVDMPHLRHEVMSEGGSVHDWLARNSSFHRHLLVPMDKDPRDMDVLNQAARIWNCDWIAVSRTDLTRHPAKMLDLLERIPVPVSLVGSDPARSGHLEIAQSDRILDGMLGAGGAPEFTPGVAATTAVETADVGW